MTKRQVMESRYIRNRIYLTKEEQEIIKHYPIFLAGSGIGSVIAECALRLGFENITIVDGDRIEMSNLNRQNYSEVDINNGKAETITKRLNAINRNANINFHDCFLAPENIEPFLKGHKIAINALDFSSEMPMIFDEVCQQLKIPVLHPYNLGWGGLVTVIAPDGLLLNSLIRPGEAFNEIKVVEYVTGYLRYWGHPHKWLEDILEEYKNETEDISPPQLAIASWMVASMCTHLLFNIATKRKVKRFPEFYLSTIMDLSVN